ncbi:hypothetical protein IFM89_024824 [Coptis chinensis]|uniref:UBA domain-containing protein n=1 Tax=Coptis chinensis TaxID=261450 RepID=A0A835HPF2_9MAGN|nr:hypothetical protein IFM89_024824 [Coptis chinensis]
MDFDYRNKVPPYEAQIPMYRPTSTNPSSSSTSFYPKVGHPVGPPLPESLLFIQILHPPLPLVTGLGIRVMIKPEYRITPPPQLLPLMEDIPRSTFQFDFDFERKVLAEAEKESPNWSQLVSENVPSKPSESHSSLGTVSNPMGSKYGNSGYKRDAGASYGDNPTKSSATDPLVSKYIASGLSREAVPFAVANYGDNPTKVREFVDKYNLLREMGFSSSNVAEALAMYDNDHEKALAYFLNSSS